MRPVMMIDPKLLEQLEGSTCFGNAHDSSAKECKMCDLQQECSAKTSSNSVFNNIKVLKPETQEAMEQAVQLKKEKTKEIDEEGLTPRQQRKKRKREEREKIGMPDTKIMTVDELWELLKERGGTCEVYENPTTQKTRLSIEIKKTYIKEYEEKMKNQEN